MKEKKCIISVLKDKCLKKTSTYHHGNLKEELLKLAVSIIQHEGIDAVTLQVLASKLGTSRSAIYRHFSSKDDLLHSVLEYGFNLFDEKIAPIFMQKEKSVIDRLYLMGEVYIQFAVDNPNLYRMLFGEKFQLLREETCDIEDEDEAQGFHALVGLLIEGQETKQFKSQDPFMLAQIIHAQVHGIASLHIDGHMHIQDNLSKLYEVSFKVMSEGLKV